MDNKELLKRFVALAPKEWKCVQLDELHATMEGVLQCAAPYERLVIALYSDRASAEALVFLWGWMEKMGIWVKLMSTALIALPEPTTVADVTQSPYGPPYTFEQCGRLVTTEPIFGHTRIESLVRACVAYWGSTGNQEAGL